MNGRLLAELYLPQPDPLGPPVPDASSQHPYRVPPGEFCVRSVAAGESPSVPG